MSARISIATQIPADRAQVWTELSTLEDHVEWMADAVELRFHSPQRTGVGTAFSCVTKVGPFTTTDEMTVDRWEEGTAIGVTHRGAVTGTGVFELTGDVDGPTEVTWSETLHFPWWMGASVGAMCAKPVLRWIWRRNLEKLGARITHP